MIQITATAKHARGAIRLAENTASAFQKWLKDSQAKAGVPTGQRILVDSLVRPTKATSSGGTKYGLPIFVGIVVLLVFVGIAIALDRLQLSAAAAAAGADGDVESALAAGVANRRRDADDEELPQAQPASR
jgi:hypothetical protein